MGEFTLETAKQKAIFYISSNAKYLSMLECVDINKHIKYLENKPQLSSKVDLNQFSAELSCKKLIDFLAALHVRGALNMDDSNICFFCIEKLKEFIEEKEKENEKEK